MCEKKNAGCGQGCADATVGEAGRRDLLEQTTVRVPGCVTASKPDFDQEADDPRLYFGRAQQQQSIPIHRVPDCDLDANRSVMNREAGRVWVTDGDEPQQQG